MASTKPIIGVLSVGPVLPELPELKTDASAVIAAIDLLGGVAKRCEPDGGADGLDGLCVIGDNGFGQNDETTPELLIEALQADIPLLAIEGGMHALNIALGGAAPIPTPSHSGEDEELAKDSMFMALGSKLADTIGGAGFVSASSCHAYGVSRGVLAPGTLASAYSTVDGTIEAFEVTANKWAIGVQWPAHRLDDQPSGFDNLFHALIGHAAGK